MIIHTLTMRHDYEMFTMVFTSSAELGRAFWYQIDNEVENAQIYSEESDEFHIVDDCEALRFGAFDPHQIEDILAQWHMHPCDDIEYIFIQHRID